MKVKINYQGREIWVEEEVKNCLDDFARKQDAMERRSRRHEVLWDALQIEGMDKARECAEMNSNVEDEVIKTIYLEAVCQIVQGLDALEKAIFVDKYFNGLKYKELEAKYNIPDSTIHSKLSRILKVIQRKINGSSNKKYKK
ncbi:MAG: hypothetical protein MJA82_09565 [Clostridia bacterium]|nr:hypothetical protein [Clostridia bacterium]